MRNRTPEYYIDKINKDEFDFIPQIEASEQLMDVVPAIRNYCNYREELITTLKRNKQVTADVDFLQFLNRSNNNDVSVAKTDQNNSAVDVLQTLTLIYNFYNFRLKSLMEAQQILLQKASVKKLNSNDEEIKNVSSQMAIALDESIGFCSWLQKRFPENFKKLTQEQNCDHYSEQEKIFLQSLTNINLYLKERARKTSIFTTVFFNKYNGQGYYFRRTEFHKLLSLIIFMKKVPFTEEERQADQIITKEKTCEEIKNEIFRITGARLFAEGFSDEFSQLLIKLQTAYSNCPRNSENDQVTFSPYVKERLKEYLGMYESMRALTLAYAQSENPEREESIRSAQKNYQYEFSQLHAETSKQFFSLEQLLKVELKNLVICYEKPGVQHVVANKRNSVI